MQVWRGTQAGLRESGYQDFVSMYLGGIRLTAIEYGAIRVKVRA